MNQLLTITRCTGMKRWIAGGLLMVSMAPWAQEIPVPALTPDGNSGWTLNHGNGDTREFDRQTCLRTEGDGTEAGSNAWLSAPLPIKPGDLYLLEFRAGRDENTSGGCAVSGTNTFNVDLADLGPRLERKSLVFRGAWEDTQQLRFGQWCTKGNVYFSDIQLRRAIPVHTRAGDLVLGAGERLVGNEYMFAHPMHETNSNDCRPLRQFNAGFNTYRFIFSEGKYLVFEHQLAGRKFTDAAVYVWSQEYNHGVLGISWSLDGREWSETQQVEPGEKVDAPLPGLAFPAERVFIRLSGHGPGTTQVTGYRFQARVDGPPMDVSGETMYAKVRKMPDQAEISFDPIDYAVAERTMTLRLTRRGVPVQEPLEIRTGQGERIKGTTGNPFPVPGTAGKHRLTLTGDQLAVDLEYRVSPYRDISAGELISEQDGIWWVSSDWKIPPQRPLPKKKGDTVRVSLAGNEAEAVQVVLCPSQPLEEVRAMASDLIGPNNTILPATNIEIRQVRYVNITLPTDGYGMPGWWPDPLVPIGTDGVNVPARTNQPFWVLVRTPRGQRAGTYRGHLTFTAKNWQQSVSIEAQVYGFDLPDRKTCVSAFGFSPGNAFRYHGVTAEADQRAVLNMYLKALSDHHISPYNPAPLDAYQVNWPKVDPANPPENPETLTVTIDWDRWVTEMRRVLDTYHFNSFTVQAHGMGSGTFFGRTEASLLGFPESSPVYQHLFKSYWGQLEQRLREEGWLDYAFVYWFDEPDPKDYEFVSRGFQRLKSAAPAIHRMLTEEIHDELIGGPDIWCPLTPMYREKDAKARQALGEKIWWYVCTGPKAPYATLFIDHPGTEMRIWLWQTWQRRIDGILIWETTYWTSPEAYPDGPQNPYEDPMSWTTGYGTKRGEKKPWGNGDGRFLYPPLAAANGQPDHPVLEPPVPSYRLEMLRDGIEDYEYFVILRNLLEERGNALDAKLRAKFEALLNVPAEVSESLTAFTFDPAPMERHRDAVAKAIEELVNTRP